MYRWECSACTTFFPSAVCASCAIKLQRIARAAQAVVAEQNFGRPFTLPIGKKVRAQLDEALATISNWTPT